MKSIAIIAAAIALTGCVGAWEHEKANLRAQGASEAHVAGYTDGCPSGQAAAGYVYARHIQDFARYEVDEEYARGWDQGFTFCKARSESVQRMIR